MNNTGQSAADDASLFREGDNCWKTDRAARLGWCIDGQNYFSAIHDSLCKAKHEILIVGWDIDSRVQLLRDGEDTSYPTELCELLEHLVEEREELAVRVLPWDFSVIYMMERETLPARAFGWQDSERLYFQPDAKHAAGASHHQKIVVIDGALAFCGGIDLTKARWDTRDHAADDSRRQDPNGCGYPPFHDAQALVSGPAASRFRELVDARWRNASGAGLPELKKNGEADALWPRGVEIQAQDVDIAIARTWTGPKGDEKVCEVLELYLDMINAAKKHIYIENQYFTSESIARALADSLRQESGPKLLIVLPGETSGWLEQATMDILRNRVIEHLRDADKFDRLRLVRPVLDEQEESQIYVHAKIMVVDCQIARIGSANLSHRSMGLDSEADIAVVDENAALRLCADLLAEHCAADMDAVESSLKEQGLFATVDQFNGAARHLAPLEIDVSDIEQGFLEPVANIADLERPITRELASDDDESPPGIKAVGAIGLLFIAIVIAVWGYLGVQSGGDGFSLELMLDELRAIADHPAAGVAALPLFILGSQLFMPVLGLIALCALLFDPWTAAAISIVGTLGATVLSHWLGSRFHRVLMQRVPDSITDKISSLASSSDVWSLAGLRLIPISPFTVVNLVIGASGVRLRPFFTATLIAMTPGIVLICLSVDRARAALAGEPVFDPWIVAGIAGAGVGVIGLRLWKNTRDQKQSTD